MIFSIVSVILCSILLNIIIIYIMHCSQSKKRRFNIDCRNRDLLYDNLQSGDIVLFRNDSAHIIPKYVFGDEFSHAGIIYKEDNIPYILEANINDESGGGVMIRPAYTRLQTYKGYICVKKIIRPLSYEMNNKFSTIIGEYINKKFSYSYTNIIKTCILYIDTKHNDDYVHCSMLVAKILVDLGIIELDKDELCIRPECFVKLYKHGKYKDGYEYSDELYELILK